MIKNANFFDFIGKLKPNENPENPKCPICGVEMERESACRNNWFCYGEREDHRNHISSDEVRHRAWEAHERMEIVFFSDIKTQKQRAAHRANWNPSLQFAIIAVADDADGDVWSFGSVRGPNGSTNFSLSCYTTFDKPLPQGLKWEIASWWSGNNAN